MKSFISNLRSFLAQERLVLWVPVALMLGIGTYFALPQEPSRWAGSGLLFGTASLWALGRRRSFRLLLAGLFLAALGFAVAQWRTHEVATPLLAQKLHAAQVEAKIVKVIPAEDGVKLLLSHAEIENFSGPVPAHIRVALKKPLPEARPGDRVSLRATLYPLPRPVMPGAFDFGRYFYFDRIGAVGFALGTPEILEAAPRRNWDETLNALRQALAQDMLAAMPGAPGTVAAALTVGEQGAIPEEEKEAMRASGLAHVLSISGLHLAMAAGIVFFAIRLLLIAVPRVGLRIHAKKIAAVFALAAAAAYLLLAGSPVPAQRSFIMVAFVLVAICLDRRGISLYALAWAAVIILLLYPESMLGASFQMSFAATLAIVAFYERYHNRLIHTGGAWWGRPVRYIAGICATSLVATLATAPFAVYHFNRMAVWSLLANVAVVPLAGFIIMPGVVLSLLLYPFGLAPLGYYILGMGVEWMIALAHLVAALPHATLALYPLSDAGLVLAAAGLLMLCLLRSPLRAWGTVPLLAGIATATLYLPPDVLISGDGRQVLAREQGGGYTLLKGSSRAFAAEAWLRTVAGGEAVKLKVAEGIACDEKWCEASINGVRFLHVKQPEALYEACNGKPDVLYAWWYIDEEPCDEVSLLIDRNTLEKGGAVALWLNKGGSRWLSAVSPDINRPWMPESAGDDE